MHLFDYRNMLDYYFNHMVMSEHLRNHHLNSIKYCHNLRVVRTYCSHTDMMSFDIYTPAGVLGITFLTKTFVWTSPTDNLWTPPKE